MVRAVVWPVLSNMLLEAFVLKKKIGTTTLSMALRSMSFKTTNIFAHLEVRYQSLQL